MWEKASTQYLRDEVVKRENELMELRAGKPKWDLVLRAKTTILRDMKLELESR